jgi:hypothetical protein
MLRKFLESPCDSDFAAELFSHYPDRSYGEFVDRLFGDEEAEPSDDFILRSPGPRSRCWKKSKNANGWG